MVGAMRPVTVQALPALKSRVHHGRLQLRSLFLMTIEAEIRWLFDQQVVIHIAVRRMA